MKETKLVMVTAKNNNKVYYMIPNDDGSWTAKYGRVGGSLTHRTYMGHEWQKKYREKLRKGYQDVTDISVVNKDTSPIKDMKDGNAQAFLEMLDAFSKESILGNYTVVAESVTQAQIDKAQKIVDDISLNVSKLDVRPKWVTKRGKNGIEFERCGEDRDSIIDSLNKKLLDLFQVIPRKMHRVSDFLLYSQMNDSKIFEIIHKEQDLLDTMASQVQMITAQSTDVEDDKTLEKLLGISIVPIDEGEKEEILHKLAKESRDKFKAAWKIIHHKSRKLYDDHLSSANSKTVSLLWHGSRNENWLSIIQTGLLIRPSNAVYTGSMFGDGIYFASRAKKSIGYSSLRGSYWTRGSSNRGFLALFDVHVGKQKVIERHTSECYKFSKDYLKNKNNYDSVYAKKGVDLVNDEFIVYDGAQCTIKYIVELKEG